MSPMTLDDPSKILMEGAKTWNAWRKRNPRAELRFISPHWYDSPGRKKGRNRVDFSGMSGWRASSARSTAQRGPARNGAAATAIRFSWGTHAETISQSYLRLAKT